MGSTPSFTTGPPPEDTTTTSVQDLPTLSSGKPVIKEEDVSELVTKLPNGCVRIACSVSGSPKPVVTWLVDGITIHVEFSFDYALLDDGSLQICYIDEGSHAGTYVCEAKNEFGNDSRTVTVTRDNPGNERTDLTFSKTHLV